MAKILSANALVGATAPTVDATTLAVTTTADNQLLHFEVDGVEKMLSYFAIMPDTTGFIVKFNDGSVTGEEVYCPADAWTEFHNTSIANFQVMANTGAIFQIKVMQLL